MRSKRIRIAAVAVAVMGAVGTAIWLWVHRHDDVFVTAVAPIDANRALISLRVDYDDPEPHWRVGIVDRAGNLLDWAPGQTDAGTKMLATCGGVALALEYAQLSAYDLEADQLARRWQSRIPGAGALVVWCANEHAIVVGGEQVTVFDLRSGRLAFEAPAEHGPKWHVTEDRHFVVNCGSPECTAWDIRSGQATATFEAPYALCTREGHAYHAIRGQATHLGRTNLATGELVTIGTLPESLRGWSACGWYRERLVVVGPSSRGLHILSVESGQPIAEIPDSEMLFEQSLFQDARDQRYTRVPVWFERASRSLIAVDLERGAVVHRSEPLEPESFLVAPALHQTDFSYVDLMLQDSAGSWSSWLLFFDADGQLAGALGGPDSARFGEGLSDARGLWIYLELAWSKDDQVLAGGVNLATFEADNPSIARRLRPDIEGARDALGLW